MSGELEHIIPTHPSEPYKATRTSDIIWCDANCTSHNIRAVYWSPTNDPNNLKLIWLKQQKILVAGDRNVAIEYFNADSDLIVNSVSIFSSSSPAGTTALMKIIHESGLYVGYGTDEGGTSTEKYGLNGWLITVNTAAPVTLYAGQKYYIVIQGSTNEAFLPAYFSNSAGNYKYPYANTTNIVNTSTEFNSNGRLKPADYKGLVNTTGQSETIPNGVGALTEGSWFTWVGDSSQSDIQMTDAVIYRRTNVDEGAFFTGAIGQDNNATIVEFAAALKQIYIRPDPQQPPISAEQKLWKCWDFNKYGHIFAKNRVTPFYQKDGADLVVIDTMEDAISINIGDYFVWNGTGNIFTGNSYYFKKDNIFYTSEIDFNDTTYNDTEQLASVYMALYGTKKAVMIKWWDWKLPDYTILTLPAGYTSKITSMTPVNVADVTPNDKEIYYLNNNGTIGVYYYENNTWNWMNPYDSDVWKFDRTSVSSGFTNVPFLDLFDDIGTPADWLTDETGQGGSSYNQTAGQSFVMTPSLVHDRKYYLEINGVEK